MHRNNVAALQKMAAAAQLLDRANEQISSLLDDTGDMEQFWDAKETLRDEIERLIERGNLASWNEVYCGKRVETRLWDFR